jgi:hypothetical protein
MDSEQWSVLNKVPLMMAELRPKHMWGVVNKNYENK